MQGFDDFRFPSKLPCTQDDVTSTTMNSDAQGTGHALLLCQLCLLMMIIQEMTSRKGLPLPASLAQQEPVCYQASSSSS